MWELSSSDDELAPLSPLIDYRGGKVSLLEIQVSYVLRHCKIDAPLWRGWEGDGAAAMADIVNIGDILRGPNNKNGPRILPYSFVLTEALFRLCCKLASFARV